MKKYLLALLLAASALTLAACGAKKPDMRTPVGEKQEYNYRNPDLGFSLMLPSEFIYYQTQRKQTPDFTDLEIFVPTSDTKYAQEVPGYAKPVVVRVFNKNSWLVSSESDKKIYQKIGEKGDKVYAIRFWDKVPSDWKNKWTASLADQIKQEFQID